MPKEISKEEREEKLRKILFVPCESKAQLHAWIKIFLGLDIPNCIVDPESTSTPMDMIFEVYNKMRLNDDKRFNRVLYYASRDSFKTLSAAILELLVVFHLGRDVAHMAAIEAQSQKSQSYVKKFMGRPFLRDYLTGDSQERTTVIRFNDPYTGNNLTERQYQSLDANEKDRYIEISNYIKIVICTPQGANSDHVPFFVVDEVDVVANPRAYEESKMIPAPINGLMPVTLLTSTRKISTGLVQREMDEAVDVDGNVRLQVRHWNIVDVTEACQPDRHLPNEPKIPIYVDDENLRALSETAFNDQNDEAKKRFKKEEGYKGCLKNCKIFPACRGLLATKQKSTSPLLKPIDHVINMFVGSNISVQTALAQLLCKKPSTEGLIYPNFDRPTHVIPPYRMAEIITGSPCPPTMSKKDLIQLMRDRGMMFYSGMDFGFTHNFAVVTVATDGARAFVIDVIAEPELLPDEQIKVVEKLRYLEPSIFADPENPQMIATLRRAGYRMRSWDKGKGTVVAGIDVVRMRLRPPMGDPLLYFLSGDPGVELLARRILKYHWKTDVAGRITDKPSDYEDDECDALRYVIMNLFSSKKRPQSSAQAPEEQRDEPVRQSGMYSKENWMKEWLHDHGINQDEGEGFRAKKGRLIVDMS